MTSAVLLPKPCAFCRSSRWCGRPCANAPRAVVTAPSAPVVTRRLVTQEPSGVVTRGKSSTERGRPWLAANRAARNAYMRDYRKRKRASAEPSA
jgi:hypothetical protein